MHEALNTLLAIVGWTMLAAVLLLAAYGLIYLLAKPTERPGLPSSEVFGEVPDAARKAGGARLHRGSAGQDDIAHRDGGI